jgi:hypothetical protein
MKPFPHTALLRRALGARGSGYRLIANLHHRGRAGTTWVYRATATTKANVPQIRALGLPDKARGLQRAGDA